MSVTDDGCCMDPLLFTSLHSAAAAAALPFLLLIIGFDSWGGTRTDKQTDHCGRVGAAVDDNWLTD